MKAWANETLRNNYGADLNESQVDVLWSFIVSIFLIGGAIGSFAGSYVADRIGR
jgi:MFS family permease